MSFSGASVIRGQERIVWHNESGVRVVFNTFMVH